MRPGVRSPSAPPKKLNNDKGLAGTPVSPFSFDSILCEKSCKTFLWLVQTPQWHLFPDHRCCVNKFPLFSCFPVFVPQDSLDSTDRHIVSIHNGSSGMPNWMKPESIKRLYFGRNTDRFLCGRLLLFCVTELDEPVM